MVPWGAQVRFPPLSRLPSRNREKRREVRFRPLCRFRSRNLDFLRSVAMVRGRVRPATREPTRQVPFSRTLAFSWHVDLVFGSAYPCAMSRSPFSSTVRNHGLCARSSDHPDAVSVSLVPISFCLHVACGTRFVVPWGHPDVLLHLPIFGTAGTKNTSSPHKHRPNTCPHSRKLSSGSRFRSFTYSLPTVHHGVQLFIRAQTLFLPTQSCCWVCLEIIILHALYNLACF